MPYGLHVPNLARAIAEAWRLLRPGGRFAFTNWVTHLPLSAADTQLLWDGMAAATLISIDTHTGLLRDAGFKIDTIDDETDAWGVILADRLRMYQKLRVEAEQAGTPAGHDDFYKSYVLFVDLVQKKAMGGARFAAFNEGSVIPSLERSPQCHSERSRGIFQAPEDFSLRSK